MSDNKSFNVLKVQVMELQVSAMHLVNFLFRIFTHTYGSINDTERTLTKCLSHIDLDLLHRQRIAGESVNHTPPYY